MAQMALALGADHFGAAHAQAGVAVFLDRIAIGGRHLEADIVFPGAPFKSNVTATRISGPAPGVGEHNDAVFGDLLGLAPDKLGELAAQGVI